MKVFRVCVYCLGDILRFVSDSFFFLTGYLLFISRGCKGIKDGKKKKTWVPVDSIFILGVYDSSVRKFSGTCRNNCAPQVETFEEQYGIIFGKL